jgi:ABC-type uncharacterized transport system involved in gliding motility auxiliary subunit
MPAAERDMLIKYAENGGRLLMMTDPRRPAEVAEIADHFGITVDKDLVVDVVQRLFAAPALGAKIVAQEYGQSPITRNLTAQDPVVFDMACSVRPKGGEGAGSPDKPTYTELVKSGPNAWGESNLSLVFDSSSPTATLEEDDIKGPVTLAVAYEKKLPPAEKAKTDAAAAETTPTPAAEEEQGKFENVSRVIVYGDSDWITNENFGFYANRDLVLNSINWLVGEEGGITIRPKSMRSSFAPIPRQTFLRIFAGSLIIPELILILGIAVWWRRKTFEG